MLCKISTLRKTYLCNSTLLLLAAKARKKTFLKFSERIGVPGERGKIWVFVLLLRIQFLNFCLSK